MAKRKRGERKPLTPKQQQLAERYLPMARSLARPHKRAWPAEWEEFESAALMALVEAAESFDPGRGVLFSTFARLRIVGALRDVQRRMGQRQREHANTDMVGSDSAAHDQVSVEAVGVVMGVTPDPPTDAEMEDIDDVEVWLRQLPPQHAAVCREVYLHGRSQVEAARRLGLSQQRLSYIHREALAMLNGSFFGTPTDSVE